MKYYDLILEKIKQGKSVLLKTDISRSNGSISNLNKEILESKEDIKSTGIEKDCFYEVIAPKERLILLGGGHIALTLCHFASTCGFDVTIVDDRIEFANVDRFKDAKEVICDDFKTAISNLKITPYDFVVVVTRGHLSDTDCLHELLVGHQPHYLGLISSKKRAKALFELLKEEGYDEGRINAICSPIGLSIGAKTPEEIAVSILAELISYKRLDKYVKDVLINTSELDINVIRYLGCAHQPLALATVISKQGSAPRGVGAKMAVDVDGNIVGTIGGGEGELHIIDLCQKIIGTKTYQTITIDMSGSVAAYDGMVCGGSQVILIEDLSI